MRMTAWIMVLSACFSAIAEDKPAAPTYLMPEKEFRRAMDVSAPPLAPHYVLVRIVHDKTKESRLACVGPTQLIRAIRLEQGLPQDNDGWAKASRPGHRIVCQSAI